MERGLLWLPLLGVFFWLAIAGWREYKKVEAYRLWAEQFEKAKYDIYAVMGLSGCEITWGTPTRKGPVNLQTFSLQDIKLIRLLVDQQPVELNEPPTQGRSIALEFVLNHSSAPVKIPFTEVALAAEWGRYLQQQWQRCSAMESTN
jgi:hypothetical protein